ncbi:MYND-type domain-containing protein [Mycena venus]|uniref:MYND-type domain-containing protein n=1 Tax=Mycena venus TaxID=2733690 RepID=A0A8H7CUE3_9AGAR|nr:MYND-type domain-containing protein [Mycena venus]
MEIAKRTTESPIHEPRAHLDGLEIPKNFTLPSLGSVRADAARSREMRKNPKEYEEIRFFFAPGSPANKEVLPIHLKLALIFNTQLPNLFKFSYFVREDDGRVLLVLDFSFSNCLSVPEDIVDDCVWALSVFIRIMEECTETVLRAMGHVKGNNDYKMSKYATLLNARGKMASHLLHNGRAQEAVAYTKAMVVDECARGNESWLQNPMPFEIYGEALVLTRTDDSEAAKMLRRAMLGVESVNWPAECIQQLIRTRAFLARALRNIGVDDEAEPHEKWLINWFRKNPLRMPHKEMKHILLPAGPILEELGGESWLENRKQTFKSEQRLAKACRTCGAREPLATLLRCNNCKYIYYWECQRTHWKHHKVECREMVATQEKIERMSLTDPDGAIRASDWKLWCNSNHDATQFGLVHALGLHCDPQRGRTHIVIKEVEYVPTATKLKHKFRVVSCGVFLINDVLRDIEAAMALDPGEGQEYVDSLFYELSVVHAKVPFIDLSFGNGISAWLGSGTISEGLVGHLKIH